MKGGVATRVVSMLPAATEIVGALGLADRLVGVSHECDHPEEILDRPRVTEAAIDALTTPGREIDETGRAPEDAVVRPGGKVAS